MTDEKTNPIKETSDESRVADNWAETMKEAMEEYIEEQGIYIRQ